MFRWSKKSPPYEHPSAEAAPAHESRPDESGDEQALDAFVQVLRAFGQHAFDLERESALALGHQCAAWARHLLTLAPPPVADGDAAPGRRDWATVVRFFVDRRQREQRHVNTALGDLHQSIWAFAERLGSVLLEDRQADDRLKSQIDRLKVALDRLSPEELKQELIAAASDLSGLLAERQQRQRERLEALGAQVADLTGQLRDAREEGARDALTKLANRRGLDDFLNRMVFLRDVFGEAACLLLIDVDHFKRVNDTHGHPTGDDVLRALADCLVRNFPRKNDLVARHGGEEFAIVLPATAPADAKRLAERMLAAIRGLEVRDGDRMIAITASVGLGQLGRSESVQGWLERTDRALYQAKANGRDRIAEATAAT